MQRLSLELFVDLGTENIDPDAASKQSTGSFVKGGGCELLRISVIIINSLDALKPNVPKGDGPVLSNRDNLLLLLEDVHLHDAHILMRSVLFDDSLSVGVNDHELAFYTARHKE